MFFNRFAFVDTFSIYWADLFTATLNEGISVALSVVLCNDMILDKDNTVPKNGFLL